MFPVVSYRFKSFRWTPNFTTEIFNFYSHPFFIFPVIQYCFSCLKRFLFLNVSHKPNCFDHLGCFLYDCVVVFFYDNLIHFDFWIFLNNSDFCTIAVTFYGKCLYVDQVSSYIYNILWNCCNVLLPLNVH